MKIGKNAKVVMVMGIVAAIVIGFMIYKYNQNKLENE